MNLQSGFFLLLLIPLILGGCTNEEQIRKSALRYFKEGNTALQHRDYQVAVWNLQKAISLDSETPNFHYNLGLAYYEIGNYPEAIESFQRVEELSPELSDTYYNLALAYYKLSQSGASGAGRTANLYYNRYQDMLSLRKARQRLEELKKKQQKEAQARSAKPEPKLTTTPAKSSKKVASPKKPKQGKSEIPGWE